MIDRLPARRAAAPGDRPRFLSEAACHDIAQRLARFAQGGGETIVTLFSTWRGNIRWARNRVSSSGEDRNDHVQVNRTIGTDSGAFVEINETTDAALVAAARRAERLDRLQRAEPGIDLIAQYPPEEPVSVPQLFVDATYQLDAARREEAAHHLAQSAVAASMLSAGYIAVSAHSMAIISSWGYAQYFQYTWAQYSVTVRDPKGVGSGWAGVDWPDWSRIDGPTLSATALDKCLTSRNPVAIEPGRFTVILEPQAVCDFVGQLVYGIWGPPIQFQMLDRGFNEVQNIAPFNQSPPNRQKDFPYSEGMSRLGERVVDERITMSADPMDPDLGFPPFSNDSRPYNDPVQNDIYHPATWIERGVLTHLAYNRYYGQNWLGLNSGLPLEGAFRMSGGPTSLAEMIATTKRGLLITRFDRIVHLDLKSLVLRGFTRDGLWLIEQGKISKPVQNMVFTESILFALNNVEQLGPPQRVFHPADARSASALPKPVIVPPIKIRDFSFTALSSAV